MDQRIADMVSFTDLKTDELRVSADFKIEPHMPSFEGHFPDEPILPAVSIIDISLFLLSKIKKDVSHADIEVRRSKFMAKVRPNQHVAIEATSEDGHLWMVVWRLKQDSSKLAQVQLVL